MTLTRLLDYLPRGNLLDDTAWRRPRIRRNAESLLVLSGEEAPRIWREPVALIDVVRAAIVETEDLDRVSFSVDERLAVLGHTVTDLTHVLAELTENAQHRPRFGDRLHLPAPELAQSVPRTRRDDEERARSWGATGPVRLAQLTPSFSAAILVPSTRFLIFWNAISRA